MGFYLNKIDRPCNICQQNVKQVSLALQSLNANWANCRLSTFLLHAIYCIRAYRSQRCRPHQVQFENGKFAAAKSGEADGSKVLQMVRGALKGVGKVSPPDEITHTGQSFDGDDYRRNRFIDRKKLVNPNWGIEMVAEVPPIVVEGRVAVCDGTGPYSDPNALGHPKVYINLDKPGPHYCPYCGLRYISAAHLPKESAAHLTEE